MDDDRLISQQGGDARRERGILRSLDVNAPNEFVAAFDPEDVHELLRQKGHGIHGELAVPQFEVQMRTR